MTVPDVSTTMWLSLLRVFVHLFMRVVGQSVGECVSVGSLPSPKVGIEIWIGMEIGPTVRR